MKNCKDTKISRPKKELFMKKKKGRKKRVKQRESKVNRVPIPWVEYTKPTVSRGH